MTKRKYAAIAVLAAGTLLILATPSRAQIAPAVSDQGKLIFVNEDSLQARHGSTMSVHPAGSLPSLFNSTPAAPTDRLDRIVHDAAERHKVDPALVKAVISTESGWNPRATSRKGAMGLMQLIPTTAVRFGVNDAFSPQQNVDAGVRYLKTLLERYNGNLDLALAAYNAGEGAVDRAHGIPAFRETREYVQKVQNAYFRPGSGRMEGLWSNPHAIRKDTESASGRVIFTNE